MRPLQCVIGRHAWTGWRKHEKGCGDHGCDRYLRRCTRCPRWQRKFPGGRPREFECRCLAFACCSDECRQGRCPSIPAELREDTR